MNLFMGVVNKVKDAIDCLEAHGSGGCVNFVRVVTSVDP